MQTRLFQAGFVRYGFWVAGLTEIGTARAGLRAHGEPARLSSAHQPARLCACAEWRCLSSRPPGSTVLFESERSKNNAGGMMPLYAARVQGLGPAMSSSLDAARERELCVQQIPGAA